MTNPVCEVKPGRFFNIETWTVDGRLHRLDGPSYIERHPETNIIFTEYWCQDGKIFRNSGPSIIRYCHTGDAWLEIWQNGNVYHRWDGPAIIRYFYGDFTEFGGKFKHGDPMFGLWYWEGNNITNEVKTWLKTRGAANGIPEDWQQWSESNLINFRCAFSSIISG